MSNPTIVDGSGMVRTWEWLWAKYGNVVLREAPYPKFELVKIIETTGPAIIKIKVEDNEGYPHKAQPVANHWPDNTLTDLTRDPNLKSLWQPRANVGTTNWDGYFAWGIGPGSYIKDLAVGGPHTVWVLSQSLFSDGLQGIGMLGGTNHHGPLSLVFRMNLEGGDVDPPGPDGPDPDPEPPDPPDDLLEAVGDVLLSLEEIRHYVKGLALHLGVPVR